MRILALLLLFPANCFAGSLFTSEEIFAIEIKADFKSLIALKTSEEKSFSATLSTGGNNMNIEIQPRGKLRREICSQLPPLKLILPKGHRIEPFDSMDRDLKMVTNCYPTLSEEDGKFAIYREYLQYKLLNAAGFSSFQVRMAEVTYRDLKGEVISQGPAFFIENIKDFAKRRGLGKKSPAAPRFEPEAELLVAENFVRNFDFFVPSTMSEENHNVRVVLNEKKQLVAMIPFDFDLSYLSRGSAAVPDAEAIAASLNSVGPPSGSGALVPAQLKRLAEKQAELLAEVEKSPIPEEEKKLFRKWIINYVMAVKTVTSVEPKTFDNPL